MRKPSKVAEVRITVLDDGDGNATTVQVSEWRRRAHYRLVAIDELGPFHPDAEWVASLVAYATGSIEWVVGDAVALDRARIV
jgi:hypothetical protein